MCDRQRHCRFVWLILSMPFSRHACLLEDFSLSIHFWRWISISIEVFSCVCVYVCQFCRIFIFPPSIFWVTKWSHTNSPNHIWDWVLSRPIFLIYYCETLTRPDTDFLFADYNFAAVNTDQPFLSRSLPSFYPFLHTMFWLTSKISGQIYGNDVFASIIRALRQQLISFCADKRLVTVTATTMIRHSFRCCSWLTDRPFGSSQ